MRTTIVHLTDEELLLLDKNCSEKVQSEVDRIKKYIANDIFGNEKMAELLTNALETGKLTWHWKCFDKCHKCGKKKEYVKFKSGPRKGQNNYTRPVLIRGLAFNEGFVTFKDRAEFGFCRECSDGVKETLIEHIVVNELPVEIQDYDKTIFIKEAERKCFECNALIWEYDMGLEYTMMGDGRYYSKCPKCGAKQIIFGKSHKSTGKWRATRKVELVKVKNCYQRKK